MSELTPCQPAGLERRFHAGVLDLLAVALPAAGLGYAVWAVSASAPVALGAAAAGSIAGGLLLAVSVGRSGTSPGRAALGIRVTSADGTGPVGAARAVLRAALLATTVVATLGLGGAVLAWSALTDPRGRRRGWHDRLVGSVVLDVRARSVAEEAAPAPAQLVNLTALRLLPAPEPFVPTARDRPRLDPPAPDATPRVRWRVRFDTGESFLVEGLTLVGRAPEGTRAGPVRRLVALGSGQVSPTHAQFQVAPDGALVLMDLGSTHGTVLARRGAPPRDLAAGRATTLLAGDRVRFGDRLMEVTREP